MTVMAAPAETKPQEVSIFVNELGQNYPNPFRNETIIHYSLAKPSQVNLSLFDMNGRLVRVLANGSRQAGKYTIRFNAGSLQKGLYFYKLQTGGYSATKRMIIQ